MYTYVVQALVTAKRVLANANSENEKRRIDNMLTVCGMLPCACILCILPIISPMEGKLFHGGGGGGMRVGVGSENPGIMEWNCVCLYFLLCNMQEN